MFTPVWLEQLQSPAGINVNLVFFFPEKTAQPISVSSLHPHTPQKEVREVFSSQPGMVTRDVSVRGCLALADAASRAGTGELGWLWGGTGGLRACHRAPHYPGAKCNLCPFRHHSSAVSCSCDWNTHCCCPPSLPPLLRCCGWWVRDCPFPRCHGAVLREAALPFPTWWLTQYFCEHSLPCAWLQVPWAARPIWRDRVRNVAPCSDTWLRSFRCLSVTVVSSGWLFFLLFVPLFASPSFPFNIPFELFFNWSKRSSCYGVCCFSHFPPWVTHFLP